MDQETYIALVPTRTEEGPNADITHGTYYIVSPNGVVAQGDWYSGGWGNGPVPGAQEDLIPELPIAASYNHDAAYGYGNFAYGANPQEDAFTIDGQLGWLRLNEDPAQFQGTGAEGRDGLGYHLDGNLPGSEGCVVFDAENGNRFFEAIAALPEDERPSRTMVLDAGVPDYLATSHDFLTSLNQAEVALAADDRTPIMVAGYNAEMPDGPAHTASAIDLSAGASIE